MRLLPLVESKIVYESGRFRHTMTDSDTGYKYIKLDFNQNIWRYGGLGYPNVIMGGYSPWIELLKLHIWSGGESSYIRIQIFIESSNIRCPLIIKSPD